MKNVVNISECQLRSIIEESLKSVISNAFCKDPNKYALEAIKGLVSDMVKKFNLTPYEIVQYYITPIFIHYTPDLLYDGYEEVETYY